MFRKINFAFFTLFDTHVLEGSYQKYKRNILVPFWFNAKRSTVMNGYEFKALKENHNI